MAESPKEPPKKPGWLDNLAQRSTGLPQNAGESKKEQESSSSAWKFAGLGLQFAATVALFTYGGYALDQKFGWFPWSTISLAMIAVIGNLYLLIKEAMTPPGPPKNK